VYVFTRSRARIRCSRSASLSLHAAAAPNGVFVGSKAWDYPLVMWSLRSGARGRISTIRVTAVGVVIGILAVGGSVAARGAARTSPLSRDSAGVRVRPGRAFTIFNLIDGTGTEEHAIVDVESVLATNAVKGSVVQFAQYDVTDMRFAQGLVEGATSGAHVQIIVDGSARTFDCHGKPGCVNPAFTELEQLNQIHARDPLTWLKTCNGIGPGQSTPVPGAGNGCVGQELEHNKFAIAADSNIEGLPFTDGVLQTSSNATYVQGGKEFNNALLLLNQPRVYADYEQYFQLLNSAADAKAPTTGRAFNDTTGHAVDTTTIATHDIATWTFPRALNDDPVPALLNRVHTQARCTNPTGTAPGPKRTHIDVAMDAISGRPRIVDALARLSNAGCRVTVIYASISRPDLHTLTTSKVAVHQLCLPLAGSPPRVEIVHDKYFLISGSATKTGANRRITYTGSENWTNSGLTRADDRLIRYVEPAGASHIYFDYLKNFNTILKATRRQAIGTRCTGSTTD
jgi:hypothetical protein